MPYFQLHQTVLAQQEHVVPSGNPFIERGLLYSTNRKSMAALMAQDQDLFIPSQENKIIHRTITPQVNVTPVETSPEPEVLVEDTNRMLSDTPGISTETCEDEEAFVQRPQDNLLENTQVAPAIEDTQVTSDETPEVIPVTPFRSESELSTSDALPQNDETDGPDTLMQVEAIHVAGSEIIPAVEQSPEAESVKERVSMHTDMPEVQKEVNPFRINDKLEHKVQFRVQMFGWKAVLIRQEIETFKEHITGGAAISSKQSADFVISQPRKILALPELPLAMENTFVPDFEIEDAAPEKDLFDISEASTKMSEEVSVDVVQPVVQEEKGKKLENPIELAQTEPSSDEEALPFRHNNLELDIIIHPSSHSKYLRKPSMDLQMHPAPRKEFVELSTEVTTLPVKRRANRQRTLELIDKFIENESDLAIKPVMVEGKSVDISKSSVSDESEIVSETLAQIYLKQGNKQKAIRIYQKLMLKFPEKSSYFESLLRNL